MPKNKDPDGYERASREKINELRYEILVAFLWDAESATSLSVRFSHQIKFRITREDIYKVLRDAIRSGTVLLVPPRERRLEEFLDKKLAAAAGGQSVDAQFRVVHVPPNNIALHLANAGGDLAFELIRKIEKEKKEARVDEEVHIAFGIGTTTYQVVKRLAERLRGEHELPRLVVHAISPPAPMPQPLCNPEAAYGLLHDVLGDEHVLFISLSAPVVVSAEEHAELANHKASAESFALADQIDILVTSMAIADDVHGTFLHYLERFNEEGLAQMKRDGWVGEVQLRPFSNDGPIELESGVKPVTMFEIDDLRCMSADPERHVILIGGPCGSCKKSKVHALQPMLAQSSLRVFDHLVLDVETATELLCC